MGGLSAIVTEGSNW
uniref:Putative E3 ubiquitin-protein ligase XBAT35 isoform X1 n=1 Tax=Rhizophora mucronata TaxID=61149 RepID=A0A2P2L3J7_RHIMU